MKPRGNSVFRVCLPILVLLQSLLSGAGGAIEVVVGSDRLEVEGPECLQLLFNRMTPVPVRMSNTTGADAELEVTTRSDVLGLVPSVRRIPAGSGEVMGQLVLIPLMAGEWKADLTLVAGDRTRTLTQRFCVLPPARLHVRVHDASNRVAPARVRVTGADGRDYAPDGHGAGEFRTEGLFELLVPAGAATVSVRSAHGDAPARETRVELPVNRTVFVELPLP